MIPPPPEDQAIEDADATREVPSEPAAAEPKGYDYTGKRGKLLEDIEAKSTPTEKNSNWAQRLGMALLASTKLAPFANMIVHPKWSEQERKRNAALQADEDQLKALNTAEGGEALTAQRLATAEQRQREKAKDKYMTVAGGGLFNTETKEWERQPTDKTQSTQIGEQQAQEIGLKPLDDGTYWLPNSAMGSFVTAQTKPEKTPTTIEAKILQVRDDNESYPTPEAKQQAIDALVADHNKLHPTAPIHGIETDAKGNATLVMFDPATQAVKKVPLGAIGKPQQQPNENARGDRSYQFNNTELDKISKSVEDALPRMSRLQETLAQGTPQADALVAPELLTVMAGGAGSGLRMNEAEISRIVGGRTQWESLKARVGAWQADPSKGFAITPEQRRQISALVSAVNDKLLKKQDIVTKSHRALIGTEDPQEHRRIVTEAREQLSAIDQAAAKPTVQHSPSTGAYRYSTDGGKTWHPGQPPQ